MPLRGKLNSVSTETTGVSILTSDPSFPSPNDVWIIEKDFTGESIGLLLCLTHASKIKNQLCKCVDNQISRTEFI